ncbi:MAG TPA: DUF6415 family natural product biosynthesis protein [Streptomyces sp.]|nr:DUF6415 family natural product biosynthesis protein [Streptomyces sp.]
MTQATDTPPTPDPSGDPIDADTINHTITQALDENTPRSYDDLAHLDHLLRGHMQLLLPIAERVIDRLWRGSVQWYDARSRLSYIHRYMGQALGVSVPSAQQQVARLAHGCSWLLERAQPQGRLCPRCKKVREDTRMVGAVESGSGPGAILYACRGCEPHGPWDAEDDLAALGR